MISLNFMMGMARSRLGMPRPPEPEIPEIPEEAPVDTGEQQAAPSRRSRTRK